MAKKPLAPGFQRFEFKPGVGGFPEWEGLDLREDSSAQPPNTLRAADNVIFKKKDLVVRGGQSKAITAPIGGNVTGIFETSEDGSLDPAQKLWGFSGGGSVVAMISIRQHNTGGFVMAFDYASIVGFQSPGDYFFLIKSNIVSPTNSGLFIHTTAIVKDGITYAVSAVEFGTLTGGTDPVYTKIINVRTTFGGSYSLIDFAKLANGDYVFLVYNGTDGEIWSVDSVGSTNLEISGLALIDPFFGNSGYGNLFNSNGDTWLLAAKMFLKRDGGAWNTQSMPAGLGGTYTAYLPPSYTLSGQTVCYYNGSYYIAGFYGDTTFATNTKAVIMKFDGTTLSIAQSSAVIQSSYNYLVVFNGYLYYAPTIPPNSYIGRFNGTVWDDTHFNYGAFITANSLVSTRYPFLILDGSLKILSRVSGGTTLADQVVLTSNGTNTASWSFAAPGNLSIFVDYYNAGQYYPNYSGQYDNSLI